MAPRAYKVIEILTSEEIRWKGAPLYEAITRAVAKERTAARCLVTRGVAGCYENGGMATHRVLDLSHNMPLKIEIVLPAPELERILKPVLEMVGDGIVMVYDREVLAHRSTGGLLPKGMLVRDVMTETPVAVGSKTPLAEVVATLVQAEFDGVPVVDGSGRLLGMVLLKDLMAKTHVPLTAERVTAIARGAGSGRPLEAGLLPEQFETLRAADVMTEQQAVVGPDTRVLEAAKLMAATGSKRLAVVDAKRHLVGMLARIDLLRLASTAGSRRRVLVSHGASVLPTESVGATRLLHVPVVGPETPARELIDLMDDEGQRVMVLDATGRPVGVISDRELLPLLEPGKKPKDDLTAGAVMRRDIPVVGLDASMEQALDMMVTGPHKRLPVADEGGAYVGMLSREELLRLLVGDGGSGSR